MEKYYTAALQSVKGIGSSRIKLLLDYFGSAQQVWQASRRDLFLSKIIHNTIIDALDAKKKTFDVEKFAEQIHKLDIEIITFNDENYPELLREIYDPPFVLYCKGLLDPKAFYFAIVGARRHSAYGRNAAAMFASQLSRYNFTIVSGGARGIDSCAHQAALENGRTVAVLGCGVDVVYPPENRRLFSCIAEQGALISEYLPGTKPCPGNFPARNRIISGMSRGVLIVEAKEQSGALITAAYALEENRDVFSVPGSIFSATSVGTNHLIRQGAKLASNINDILEEYHLGMVNTEQGMDIISNEEQIVLDLLDYEHPKYIDEIINNTDFPIDKLTYILMILQLRGYVYEHSGQRYTLKVRGGK